MKTTKFTVLILFCILFINLNAQVDVKQKVVNQTNNETNKTIDQGIKKGVDGVKGLFKKKTTNTQTENKTTENEKTANKTAESQPSLVTYSKYDFIPGEKVIFYEDFAQDAIGDFPALWNTNGSAEVVTTNLFPGKWVRFSMQNAIWTDALLNLPDNYTIEFDVIPVKGTEGRMAGYGFRLISSINAKAFDYGAVPGKAGFYLECEYFGRLGYRTYINGEIGDGLGLSGSKEEKETYEQENQKYHIALWAQKARIRLYQNETKLFDLPKAFPVTSIKMDRIRFEDGAAMVSNIRIAVGAPDTRNKLLTEGKLITYGIYFDVNKDQVKPESYGTLKDISTVLTENPGIRVKIIGHTDSDGDAAMNLDLSKRRAASVKNALSQNFGIDASRVETDGKGATQPVAANDSPVNKALNRRVEFVKL
ncbi:MAG: OmpA family protein [Bacteroidota bacterium]|nr:OmpA family protein [Bacteroidota bacterium]